MHNFDVRKRTTGISFSEHGEIILAFAICSPLDRFNKKIARGRILKRIRTIIETYDRNLALNAPREMFGNNSSFYFQSIDQFLEFCELFDHTAGLFFTPQYVLTQQKLKDALGTIIEQNIEFKKFQKVELGDVYFHQNFIMNSLPKFLSKLNAAVAKDKQPTA